MKILKIYLNISLILLIGVTSLFAQSSSKYPIHTAGPFVHPGIAQNSADLEFMKKQVQAGEQPWKAAFERLKQETPLNYKPRAVTHLSQEAYGADDAGGKQLEKDAQASYKQAIMWYLTNDQTYANNAIAILKCWADTLWDMDGNNAKLLAGLTGHYFLNTAEILKYTHSGWKEKDITQFKRLMLTVYYPLIKDFFPEANGNWDASMIDTQFGIGVFCDNREIFNTALNRFYFGTGNGGITKYIYPGGQIQESTRDWGHVQLGLGEFAKAAQVAWTQHIDLYKVAGNRLALGFEYASNYMVGNDVPIYGIISPRERGVFRDIYESIYDHYHNL